MRPLAARYARPRRCGPRPDRPSVSDQEPPIDTALGLLAVVLLVAANGFFVAAEFALVALDRSRLEQRVRAGDRRAAVVQGLVRHLSFHLSGAQLGITVTSLIVGFLAGPVLAELLAPLVEPLVGAGAVDGVSVVLALVVATVGQMVLGELVPKTIAIAEPERTSMRLARSVAAYGTVFGPVIRVLNRAADATVRLLGVEPREELSTVRSLPELQLLFEASADEGVLARSAEGLLHRSIRLGSQTAADALVPRVSVTALPLEATAADLAAVATETGHSRFPVYGTDLDDVRGVVHVKSLHGLGRERWAATPVAEIMGEAPAVPESRELDELLVDMRDARNHLAIVIDEHGGTAGIITLEDVIEEIVGEISDEYDVALAALARPLGAGRFQLAGSLHPHEVSDVTGFDVPEGDYETLAGFVLDRLGRIPVGGEQVEVDGWTLEVLEMDRRRVSSVLLIAPRPPAVDPELEA